MSKLSKPARDNRADQLNPNNPAFQSSRGLPNSGGTGVEPCTPQVPQQARQPEPRQDERSKKR